jgi:hypothetical protein
MNIRLIAVLIAFLALPMLAQAADKAANAAATQRATVLKSQNRGATVTSNKQRYQILPGVRAAKIQPQERPQQTLTRAGGGQMIETKGPYVVFTAAQQGAVSVMQVNGAMSYPTVINSRTGGIGILPGTVRAQLKNVGSAAAIASYHGLELVREFAHLRTAFFRARPGQDVVAASASLAADSRVVSAEVDVLEHVNVPH